MAANLIKAGVPVAERDDGMEIRGVDQMAGGAFESFGDHRIAMSMLVAGLAARTACTVNDVACIATSFPDFLPLLSKVASR